MEWAMIMELCALLGILNATYRLVNCTVAASSVLALAYVFLPRQAEPVHTARSAAIPVRSAMLAAAVVRSRTAVALTSESCWSLLESWNCNRTQIARLAGHPVRLGPEESTST